MQRSTRTGLIVGLVIVFLIVAYLLYHLTRLLLLALGTILVLGVVLYFLIRRA